MKTPVSLEGRVGAVVPAVRPKRPGRIELAGRVVALTPIIPGEHGDELWEGTRTHDDLWTYMAQGPFSDRSTFDTHVQWMASSEDPIFYAIVERVSKLALGYASYLRIELNHRVIEVGNIVYTPKLQRTVGATEAMYLMMRYAFEELGYRRYEWKCDSNNMPSRRAALRLGFQFEGIFRQHMIVKGLNRDTAWFSIMDSEWPKRKRALETWLNPENFDGQGRQKLSLSKLNESHDGETSRVES
jgi:RimJ/RimL family protein N-acetyltransferase